MQPFTTEPFIFKLMFEKKTLRPTFSNSMHKKDTKQSVMIKAAETMQSTER